MGKRGKRGNWPVRFIYSPIDAKANKTANFQNWKVSNGEKLSTIRRTEGGGGERRELEQDFTVRVRRVDAG